jgi:purine-binding chemotaxis protein CheW
MAIAILRLHDAIPSPVLKPVSSVSPAIRGVIDYRGSALPVLDVSMKLAPSTYEGVTQPWIIVLDVSVDGERVILGVLAERIGEAFELDEDRMHTPTGLGASSPAEFLRGLAQVDSRVIPVVDMDLIVSAKGLQIASALGDTRST